MRRADGILLAEGDVAALVVVLQHSARVLHDVEAARLAVALAALSASGQPTETVEPVGAIVELGEWCRVAGVNRRTARRHAADGRLRGAVKRGNRWLVLEG